MSNVDVIDIISNINYTSGIKNPVHYYLNGGCYIFAKKLQSIVGGDLYYLVKDYHFLLKLLDKYYDASGNVTSKYSNCKMISEREFLSRKKLRDSIDLS